MERLREENRKLKRRVELLNAEVMARTRDTIILYNAISKAVGLLDTKQPKGAALTLTTARRTSDGNVKELSELKRRIRDKHRQQRERSHGKTKSG